MQTLSRVSLAASLLLTSVRVLAAQSVDDIIERHLAASGGRAALEKLETRVITGTIALTSPAGTLSGPIQIFSAKPGKERTLISLDLSALGAAEITVDRRFDGINGYVIDTLQGNRELTGVELQNMRNNAYGFPEVFLFYRQGAMALTLRGREKVGTRDAYVLVATPKAGSTQQVFIDAATFLTLKSVASEESPQAGQFEQTTELLDYRDVDGVKIPFQIKASSTAQSFSITISKIEHNVKIDPTIFTKPAN